MIEWLKKHLNKSNDNRGLAEKIESIKAKREAAKSVIDLCVGFDRRKEDHGNLNGFERRLNWLHVDAINPVDKV